MKALLIGIGKYEGLPKESQLDRAATDAAGIAQSLQALGVPKDNIVTKKDVDRSTLMREWEAHLGRLGPKDVSIFYFSGHGVERNQRPYLLASKYIRGDPPSTEGVDLAAMLSEFKQRFESALGIFIIDACRSDITRPGGKSDDAPPSFAHVRAPRGTIVLYSASPGEKALETLGPGDDSPYSLYTRVLLGLLHERARGLHEIAKTARWEVAERARGRRSRDGRVDPHMQVPIAYDEVIHNHNLLGTPIEKIPIKLPPPPSDEVASKAREKQQLALRSSGKGIDSSLWQCRECPEMVVLPPVEGSGRRFAIGKYEVTRGDWLRFEALSDAWRGKVSLFEEEISPDDRQPMTRVTWEEARMYADWLGGMVGIATGAPAKFRLPTETEWEHAARAGGTAPWPSGHDQADLCNFANGADASLKSMLWTNVLCEDGKARATASVGSYQPNAYGLHDTAGNVWEWVAGCGAKVPASGESVTTTCDVPVAKGGSWRSGPDALRYTARQVLAPDHRRETVGFRILQELD